MPDCRFNRGILLIRARGIKIAVLSNKQDPSVKSAVRHFFGDLVDLAFGGREGVPLKPDAGAVLPLLSELMVTPHECAFVGDSDVDVLTGRNAGCALTLAVTWGYRSREVLTDAGAEYFADTPDEVLKFIKEYNEKKDNNHA